QIFAHEIEFVYVIIIGRMEGGLRRRHREDQPAVAGVHGLEAKDVPKKGPVSFRILAINDHMSARDHVVPPVENRPRRNEEDEDSFSSFFVFFVSSWLIFIVYLTSRAAT